MTRTLTRLTLSAIVLATGCSDPANTPTPTASNDRPPEATAEVRASANAVAHALALALTEPSHRQAVRDAMRASPWDEHKLLLHEYLETPAGRSLLDAAAAAAGVSPRALRDRVASLPPLDFYMPLGSQRRSWEPTQDVAVLTALDGRAPYHFFDATGAQTTYTAGMQPPERPFLALQFAEYKGVRVGAQAAGAGHVIEDAGDGTSSEVLVFHTAKGSTVIDFATLTPEQRLAMQQQVQLFIEPECDPTTAIIPCEEENPPPYNPPSQDYTTLEGVQVNACDDDMCWFSLEIRVEFGMHNSAGTQVGYGEYRRGSVGVAAWTPVFTPIIGMRLSESGGGFNRSNLIEEDRNDLFGMNKDDYCGSVQFGASGNGALQVYPLQYPGCWRAGHYSSGFARFSWVPKP